MNDKNLLTEQNLSKLLEQEAGQIDLKLDLWPLIQQQLKNNQASVEPITDDTSPLLEPIATGPKPLLTFPRVTKFLLGMAAVLALVFIAGVALLPGKNDASIPSIPPPIQGANPTVPATPHVVTGTLQATLTGHTEAVRALTWKSDGTQLASVADDAIMKIWDTGGKLQETITFTKKALGWPYSITWPPESKIGGIKSGLAEVLAPDGKLDANLINQSEVELRKPDGSVVARLSVPGGTIDQLAWSPDSKIIAGSGFAAHGTGPAGPGDVRVWLWRTDGTLITSLEDFYFPINSMGWSTVSKNLAIAAKGEQQAGLWSAEGKSLVRFDSKYVIWELAWSPDGQTLAAACSDNMVRLFGKTGDLEATLSGHQDEVWSVAWSPDGKTLASGSGDKTIKLWTIK